MSIIYKSNKFYVFNLKCTDQKNCGLLIQFEIINKLEKTNIQSRFKITNEDGIQFIEVCSSYGVEIVDGVEYLFGVMVKLKFNNNIESLDKLLFMNNDITFDTIIKLDKSGYKLLSCYSFMLSNNHLIIEDKDAVKKFKRYLNWFLNINCCELSPEFLSTKYIKEARKISDFVLEKN